MRRLLRDLGVALLVCTGLVIAPHAAVAAPADGSITGVTVDEDSAPNFGSVTVRFTFVAPETALPGDTFTLTMPPSLQAFTSGFDVTAPDGSVVATAVFSGGVGTFTYTDYIAANTDVSGSGFFSALFSTSEPAGTDVPLVFPTNGPTFTDTITVLATPPIDRSQAVKSGTWSVLGDQGVTQPAGALRWQVATPVGPATTTTVVDTVGTAQVMDCGSITVDSTAVEPGTGNLLNPTPAAPNRYSTACDDTGFTLTMVPTGDPALALQAGEVILLTYTTSITDATLATYGNQATVTTNALTSSASATVNRFGSGGEGGGTGLGTVNIVKVLTGVDATDQTGPFVVAVTCTVNDIVVTGFPKTVTFTSAGTQQLTVPAQASCNATETETGGATSTTISGPVVIGATPVTITVTNTFDPPALGILNVTKVLAGADAAGQSGPFVVTVSCVVNTEPVDGYPRALTFTAAATQQLMIPVGASCTAEETEAGTATSSEVSAAVVVGATPVTLTITNTFDAPPPPTPVPPGPSGGLASAGLPPTSLASTGLDSTALGATTLAFLALGAVLMGVAAARRR